MRRLLDGIYGSAAALAALFLVSLLVMVLLSIASRQLNFQVPGSDAYAGYLMAASGFLALAHTLKRGEHIRVTLVINALSGASRKALEVWALSAAFLLALLMNVSFASSQLSPTHICTAIISDYFGVTFFATVKKLLPLFLLTVLIACGYYMLLTAVF